MANRLTEWRPQRNRPTRFWITGLLLIISLAGQCGYSQQKSTATKPKSGQDSKRKPQDDLVEKLEERLRKQKNDLELLKLFAESLSDIEKKYVEPIDRRRLIEAAIQGMLDELDGRSRYIPAGDVNEFEEGIEAEFGGIGILVQKKEATDFVEVVYPVPNGPSDRAGVKPGWLITRIENSEAKGISIPQAIKRLRGKLGTVSRVTFRDPDSGKDVELRIRRETISVETVLGDIRLKNGTWDYFLRRNPDQEKLKLGYVRITSFGNQTYSELQKTMNHLVENGLRGCILDLRNNTGGFLQQAVKTCDLFLEKGVIVRTEGRNERSRKWQAKSAGTLKDFPLVILVNQQSASASEIVAACLKDHQRAVVVGQRTFGKGSVQSVYKLENGKSRLVLTTAVYIRPNGRNIDRKKGDTAEDEWGVSPNEGMEIVFDQTQLENYLEYRRNRDVPNAASLELKGKEFEDSQLNKAIEYITQELEERSP